MAKKGVKPVNELKYEEAFQELRDLVDKLESNDLQLEQGVELYERGQQLMDRCTSLLADAELKIKEISSKASGTFVEKDLHIEEE